MLMTIFVRRGQRMDVLPLELRLQRGDDFFAILFQQPGHDSFDRSVGHRSRSFAESKLGEAV